MISYHYKSYRTIYSGDLNTLVNELLKPKYRNVWLVVGGPMLANAFIQQKLADEIRLSVLPVLLGEGTSFFAQMEEQSLHLVDVTTYKNGMVEMCYEIKKGSKGL